MIRSSFLKNSIWIVQIIALMICTVASGGFWGTAQESTTTSPTSATSQTTTTTAANTVSDILTEGDMANVQTLQNQRALLQQEAQALQEARQYYTHTLEGLLQQKTNIEEQIALKQREIDINTQLKDSLTAQIDSTDEELIAAEQSLLVRRQTILERFEALRQKLRALSKGGNLTTIQMLLSTDSYESFLINYKMATRISEIDQETINSLEDELADLQRRREMLNLYQDQLEEERRPFESARQDLETARAELLALHAEASKISEQLSSNITYYRQQYVELINQQTLLQQQITNIIGKYDMTGVVAPSVMHWPSPDCTIITSSYKSRWGSWHYGVDIASWGDSTGKGIVAAADGTVIFASSDDSGYGNYVMIDHGYDIFGQRIITLYGHCDKLYVEVGDIVFGGQTPIAAVGNSGRSKGPHLHFEVRVDGNAVDPIANGYLLTDGITVAD